MLPGYDLNDPAEAAELDSRVAESLSGSGHAAYVARARVYKRLQRLSRTVR
jgi:hypothetical protein